MCPHVRQELLQEDMDALAADKKDVIFKVRHRGKKIFSCNFRECVRRLSAPHKVIFRRQLEQTNSESQPDLENENAHILSAS